MQQVQSWREGHALIDFLPFFAAEALGQAADDRIRHKVALQAALAEEARAPQRSLQHALVPC